MNSSISIVHSSEQRVFTRKKLRGVVGESIGHLKEEIEVGIVVHNKSIVTDEFIIALAAVRGEYLGKGESNN
jgi:hypothetical protein